MCEKHLLRLVLSLLPDGLITWPHSSAAQPFHATDKCRALEQSLLSSCLRDPISVCAAPHSRSCSIPLISLISLPFFISPGLLSLCSLGCGCCSDLCSDAVLSALFDVPFLIFHLASLRIGLKQLMPRSLFWLLLL